MPSWVKDEEIWTKAKSVVKPCKDQQMYWASVTTIYKLLGGRVQ